MSPKPFSTSLLEEINSHPTNLYPGFAAGAVTVISVISARLPTNKVDTCLPVTESVNPSHLSESHSNSTNQIWLLSPQ